MEKQEPSRTVSPRELFNEESEVIIDRRQHGKKVAPPDVNPMEAPTPSCVQHLGVTKKVAQKRIRQDEEETNETYKAVEKEIVGLNIGYKRLVNPIQTCSFNAQ
ncbi:hypothetical protein EGW08_013391 [Elysia chlorotica]|uniref:Uncharacterized protein n=1 Tax=Elysia chlorotica TaxID=188477 RepID=A0A433TBB7_ELYCH|nr:hypothetical protein EGW08_013391 [Elysia chlorotica]